MPKEFSSEGFDLDALASAAEDVVLELGGTATVVPETVVGAPPVAEGSSSVTSPDGKPVNDPMSAAEALKQQGNEAFKKKEWQRAQELYSDAINRLAADLNGRERKPFVYFPDWGLNRQGWLPLMRFITG